MANEGSTLQGRQPLSAVRAWSASHPVATAAVAYGLVALLAAGAAFAALFTQFALYDDEGTLLIALKAFAGGQVLYRDIYAAYGPFFFDVFGGFFALTGIAATNDAARLIASVVWIATSIGFGIAAQRLTGRLALGIAGMIVAFAALSVLASESMHPQVAIAPLLAAITLVVVAGPGRRIGLSGALAGGLLACLVLTKINVGGYAVVAAALAAVLAWEPLYRRRWLRWAAVLLLLALPFLIMYPDLREQWVRDLAALELFSLAAIAIAAHGAAPDPGEDSGALRRWMLAALAGGVAVAIAILGFLVLTGPSVSEAYDGIVTQGLKLRHVLITPLTAPGLAIDLGVLAVAGAGLGLWLRGERRSPETAWPGLLRVAAGVAIWFTVAGSPPLSLNPAGNFIALPMALAWVAAFAPAGLGEVPYRRFARLFLTLLAVCQTLQVYPVAGSQVRISSLAFVAVGAICLRDGIGQLSAWSERSGWGVARLRAVSTAGALTIAAVLGFHVVVSAGVGGLIEYGDRESLALPGARLLRPDPAIAEELTEVVDLIHEHRCTALIGFPNVDSLYLMSGVEPPKPNPPGAWPIVLPLDQEQRVVDQMRASPRPCVVRDDELANVSWLHNAVPDEGDPLIGYIFRDFETAKTIGEFEFQVPKRPERR